MNASQTSAAVNGSREEEPPVFREEDIKGLSLRGKNVYALEKKALITLRNKQ